MHTLPKPNRKVSVAVVLSAVFSLLVVLINQEATSTGDVVDDALLLSVNHQGQSKQLSKPAVRELTEEGEGDADIAELVQTRTEESDVAIQDTIDDAQKMLAHAESLNAMLESASEAGKPSGEEDLQLIAAEQHTEDNKAKSVKDAKMKVARHEGSELARKPKVVREDGQESEKTKLATENEAKEDTKTTKHNSATRRAKAKPQQKQQKTQKPTGPPKNLAKKSLKATAGVAVEVTKAELHAKVNDAKAAVDKAAKQSKADVIQKYKQAKQDSASTGKSGESLYKLNEEKEKEMQRIKAKHAQLLAKEMKSHAVLFSKKLKARTQLQQEKMQSKIHVLSSDMAIQSELPDEIAGLQTHFKNKALHGTESHPFQEVELRHAGLQYNKLRHHVLTLSHRLAVLQQKATDRAAAQKYEQEEKERRDAEDRLKDKDQDAMAHASMSEADRKELEAQEAALMGKKEEAFRKEKKDDLKHEEAVSREAVQQDETDIKAIKAELKSLITNKFISSDVEPSTELEQIGVENESSNALDVTEEEMKDIHTSRHAVGLIVRELHLLEQQQQHMMKEMAMHIQNHH